MKEKAAEEQKNKTKKQKIKKKKKGTKEKKNKEKKRKNKKKHNEKKKKEERDKFGATSHPRVLLDLKPHTFSTESRIDNDLYEEFAMACSLPYKVSSLQCLLQAHHSFEVLHSVKLVLIPHLSRMILR